MRALVALLLVAAVALAAAAPAAPPPPRAPAEDRRSELQQRLEDARASAGPAPACRPGCAPGRECRGALGCVNATAPDARRVLRAPPAANATTVKGTCSRRRAGAAPVAVECTLRCPAGPCPRGDGWAYRCSGDRCVRAEALFDAAPDAACRGDARRDACGVCGGPGRDLCGRCSPGAAAGCAFPNGTRFFDAIAAPSSVPDGAVQQALANLTGEPAELFMVTSRGLGSAAGRRAAQRRGARAASRPAALGAADESLVFAYLGSSADAVALLVDAGATGSTDASGLYAVRDLGVVAAGAAGPGDAGPPPIESGAAGSGSAAATVAAAIAALALALLP